MRYQIFILVSLLFGFSLSIYNPGSLVSIPFPLKPPQVNLNLPIKIQPIVVNSLQLSQIYLKSLTYDWEFTESLVTIKISNTRIFFEWLYKKDQGDGTFTQTQYELQLSYKFVQNNKNRIDIQFTSSKSKLGHSAVKLGGNASQTVIIEVTNLIMNHAALTFRKIIENAITGAVKSFASILSTDIKIHCLSAIQNSQIQNQLSEKCAYINTTLVAPPIVSNKTLLIQINGAPYLSGQKSGYLNPDQVLVKSNSSKIELQVHEKLIQQTVNKILKVIPQKIQIWIGQVSSTPDINSLTLSPVFPRMLQFAQVRDILFSVINPSVITLINQTTQTIQMKGKASLSLYSKQQPKKQLQRYMKPCSVSFQAGLAIIYGWKSLNLRVSELTINEIQCDQEDINQNYFRPDQFYDISPTLGAFLRAGINGDINQKIINIDFNGIQAVFSGKIVQKVMRLDISLNPSQQIPAQTSGVNVLLSM